MFYHISALVNITTPTAGLEVAFLHKTDRNEKVIADKVELIEPKIHEGFMKKFFPELGYGFIALGESEIFVHKRSFESFENGIPKIGDTLTFCVDKNLVGKLRAVQVKFLESCTPLRGSGSVSSENKPLLKDPPTSLTRTFVSPAELTVQVKNGRAPVAPKYLPHSVHIEPTSDL